MQRSIDQEPTVIGSLLPRTITPPRKSQTTEWCIRHRVEMEWCEAIAKPFCPHCVDEETFAAGSAEVTAIASHRTGLESRKWADRYQRLAIGKRFLRCTFDGYQIQPGNASQAMVLTRCRRYAETFAARRKDGDSMILTGGPGTGKNHLAAAICKTVADVGMIALHTTALKLVREIKTSWRRENEISESDAIAVFTRPDLLVIDEVGCQFGSQTEQVLLMEVINARYADMLPTILLSNLPVDGLEAVLGKQIADRFYEGQSAVLVLDWESYRRKND